MTLKTPSQQRGVALAVSLVFLVLITIIGVTAIRGTTMNELITANAEQKSITFQLAESVIEGIWDFNYVLENTPAELINPPVVVLNENKNGDAFNDLLRIPANHAHAEFNVSVQATLQYCGESPITTGEQLSADLNANPLSNHVYSVHGTGQLQAAHASSENEKRGYVRRPGANRTGNCP